jgi:hypothetical protein
MFEKQSAARGRFNRTKLIVLGSVFAIVGVLSVYISAGMQQARDFLVSEHRQVNFAAPARLAHLSDPNAVRAFLALLSSGEVVRAHHSHPLDGLTFSFEDERYVYVLGRDNDNADEYWLGVKSSPRLGALHTALRQFHSVELTAWLARNGVTGHKQ